MPIEAKKQAERNNQQNKREQTRKTIMMRTKDNITSSVATIASCAAALLMFMPLGAKAQSASASDDGEVDRTPHIHGTLRSKYEYQTSEGEGRFEVRNARGDVKDKLKKAIKDGLSEDLEKDAEADLQKIHDKYIKKIDALLEEKQKEIMTV